MTGQVRHVTSWMISAGPDARTTGANAYVSAGATRIRAVGACPSRLLPPVPRSRSSSLSPSRPRLVHGAVPSAASTSVPLWPAITRTRVNSSPFARPGPIAAKPPAKTALPSFVHRHRREPPERCTGIEAEKERKVERKGAHPTSRRTHTKLYRGESNLPAVPSIGDFHADDARRIARS